MLRLAWPCRAKVLFSKSAATEIYTVSEETSHENRHLCKGIEPECADGL